MDRPLVRPLTVLLALGLVSLVLLLWLLASEPSVPMFTRSCPVPDANGQIPQAAWDAGCRP